MHNEAAVLDAFFERIGAAVAGMGVETEIICVDDGSRDATLTMLVAQAASYRRVKVVALARNFGK